MPPPEIVGMDWPDFLDWFKPRWEPGQHLALIAPTGEAKTTAAVGILEHCRKFVAAFDPKGGDKTLARSGWPRVAGWPPPKKAYEAMAEGQPYRCRVGPRVGRVEDLPILRSVQKVAIDEIFAQGGWTVAIDEFQLFADRRLMNLGIEAERLLIAARDKGVSVVTLFQAPRWVPRAASDQANWVMVGLTQDTDVINRLGEILGRPKEEIRGAVRGLSERKFAWLVANQNSRVPLVVTIPDKVRLKAPAA